MNLKQMVAVAGIVAVIAAMTLTAAGVIAWDLFWIIILLLGGFTYFIYPKLFE